MNKLVISSEYFLSYSISESGNLPWGPIAKLKEIYIKSKIHVYDLCREEEIQKQMKMLSAELFSKIGVDNLIIQFWTGAQMIE